MKSVLVLTLILISFLGFSQDEMGQGEDPVLQDEAALQELENTQQKRTKQLETITHIVEGDSSTPKQMKPGALFNNESLAEMEKILKDANLSQVNPEELRVKILELFKGSLAEGYVNNSPRLQNFFVDLLRDEKALLYCIRIFKDKARLKIYLYFWIAIMFAAYYTKRLFISKYWSGMTRMTAALLFSLTVSTITLSTFCLVFQEEMKPLIGLVKKHL